MPTRYGYVYNATQSLGNCSAGTNSTEGMVSGWEGMVMDVFEGFENDTLGCESLDFSRLGTLVAFCS